MKARELDKRFDDGEDVKSELDLANVRRPDREQRRVNVDFPVWMIDSLDREAIWRHASVHHRGLDRRETREDSGLTAGLVADPPAGAST